MTIDERLEAVAQDLQTLTHIHLDNDREYRERFQQLTAALQQLTGRLDQLTGDVQQLSGFVQKDAEHIRGLVRIAELHHARLTRLEEQ
jgi:hypothetical protein